MFYTVTLNPCFDRTVRLSEPLTPGTLHRLAAHATVTPGGKGVNVSRALTALGAENIALAAVGGERGIAYLDALRAEGIKAEALPSSGVRENISVLSAGGTQTELNEPGFPAPDAEAAATAYLKANLKRGDTVILSGSLPPECDAGVYARLTEAAHAAEANVVVDASGEALSLALDAGADLIKPNTDEFRALCREKLPAAILPGDTCTDAARRCLALSDAAEEYVGVYGGTILVTDGAYGAVYADTDAVVYSPAEPVETPRALKGAGDTYLAAFLWATLARRMPVFEAMRAATSAAAALVACGTLPEKDALLALYESEKKEQ